jgi:hypothetical protein
MDLAYPDLNRNFTVIGVPAFTWSPTHKDPRKNRAREDTIHHRPGPSHPQNRALLLVPTSNGAVETGPASLQDQVTLLPSPMIRPPPGVVGIGGLAETFATASAAPSCQPWLHVEVLSTTRPTRNVIESRGLKDDRRFLPPDPFVRLRAPLPGELAAGTQEVSAAKDEEVRRQSLRNFIDPCHPERSWLPNSAASPAGTPGRTCYRRTLALQSRPSSGTSS